MKTTDSFRLLLLSAIWGASFLFMRIIVPVLGVLPTSVIRVALSSFGLLVILLLMQCPLRFHGKFRPLLLLGTVSSGIPVLMYNIAAQYLPAGYSAILNATTPLMGIAVGALFFSEKFTIARFGGMLFGVAGVAVLTQTGPVAISSQILAGATGPLAPDGLPVVVKLECDADHLVALFGQHRRCDRRIDAPGHGHHHPSHSRRLVETQPVHGVKPLFP